MPETYRHSMPSNAQQARQDGIARQFETVNAVSHTISSLAEDYRRLARRLATMKITDV
ncbi:hypothetical protein [Mongoliimonas terrestris]|uniref:hypothetical protein n=1 Tax=Mongoliimonas terrestris TaxID=1709001 RepID=UPI000AF94188|nr:hypothetical protein [Mongoliimonas terrestris]